MAVDQLAHARVARESRVAAEDDGNEISPVAVNRSHEIEAGIARVSGLDAVNAGDRAQEMVVIAHRRAVIDESGRREIPVVARKAIRDRAPEQRQIARGGQLIVVRQT